MAAGAGGEVVVITGASAGFGLDTAVKLANAGFQVFGTMRDPNGRNASLKQTLERIGITVVDIDVTDQGSVDRGADLILTRAGRVDALINNAGTAHFGVEEAHTPASVERQFATNVIGPHRMDRAFLPGMRARRHGLIVFVSSVVGRFVAPFNGVYAASKWALEAMAEALSYEVKPFGVDIAIVEPGPYATNILNVIIQPDDARRLTSYGAMAQAGETLATGLAAIARDPGEVGDAILALVRAPAGTRPLRTVVPKDSPVSAINAAVAPIQREILESRGLGEFLAKA
jgi:NAD(P)-dependent dehydrogenase (short-subunit alcohol dehydrogenase family)